MAGDPIKQAEEMLAEGVGLSEFASSMSVDKNNGRNDSTLQKHEIPVSWEFSSSV